MVSKTELQAEIDDLHASLEAEREAHRSTHSERDRLKIDNDAHRARERARMRSEHGERQRARQEAEREDKRKRRQELSDGLLRMKDASEWAIVRDERGTVLELTVLLPADVEPIVHGVLTKKNERAGVGFSSVMFDEFNATDWQRNVQDSINKMSANVLRARYVYGF